MFQYDSVKEYHRFRRYLVVAKTRHLGSLRWNFVAQKCNLFKLRSGGVILKSQLIVPGSQFRLAKNRRQKLIQHELEHIKHLEWFTYNLGITTAKSCLMTNKEFARAVKLLHLKSRYKDLLLDMTTNHGRTNFITRERIR
ncbi:MAG: hypothetical protein NZO16_01585 [Deltaproteobacteria bacterium]|nr:hypothetical protein [Deltaproteobacteria bacterium]